MSVLHPKINWNDLSPEIRLTIYSLLFTSQAPRIVEVRTKAHPHHDYEHTWCPRFSPSPRPLLFNICHEARQEALHLAERAGHLILFSPPTTTAHSDPEHDDHHHQPIFFNHEIDTLLVHNEKDYWIRDWGPEGILTQFQAQTECFFPQRLRFLAIDLEPWSRRSTSFSVSFDLAHFSALKEFAFVVKEGDSESNQEAPRWVYIMNRRLVEWKRSGIWGRNRPGTFASPDLETFKLAIRRGESFQFMLPFEPSRFGRLRREA